MVEHLAKDAVDLGLGIGDGLTDAAKQQFRDALAKFVDERIALAFAARVRHVERPPWQGPEE